MAYSFGYGDKAIFNGHKGKIISVFFNRNGDKFARIKFDDDTLVPPEMEVPESHLKPVTEEWDWYGRKHTKDGYRYGPASDVCPLCGDKWTVTEHPIFGKKELWHDCRKCNTKREDFT